MGEKLEGQELTSEEQRAQLVEQQKQELLRRREEGELDPVDYEVINIRYLQEEGKPVTRKDVGNHAIVMRTEEFEVLGNLEFINKDGEKVDVVFDEDYDTSQPLIIFPEELGEEEPPK